MISHVRWWLLRARFDFFSKHEVFEFQKSSSKCTFIKHPNKQLWRLKSHTLGDLMQKYLDVWFSTIIQYCLSVLVFLGKGWLVFEGDSRGYTPWNEAIPRSSCFQTIFLAGPIRGLDMCREIVRLQDWLSFCELYYHNQYKQWHLKVFFNFKWFIKVLMDVRRWKWNCLNHLYDFSMFLTTTKFEGDVELWVWRLS